MSPHLPLLNVAMAHRNYFRRKKIINRDLEFNPISFLKYKEVCGPKYAVMKGEGAKFFSFKNRLVTTTPLKKHLSR